MANIDDTTARSYYVLAYFWHTDIDSVINDGRLGAFAEESILKKGGRVRLKQANAQLFHLAIHVDTKPIVEPDPSPCATHAQRPIMHPPRDVMLQIRILVVSLML